MSSTDVLSFKRKLIWANEHRKTIVEMLAPCAYSECQIVPEEDAEGKVGFLRVRLPEPPADLPFVIGDFLFNVRASLDYLVYALVEANPPNNPTTRNMFPICSTSEAFADQVRGHRLDGIPEKAKTLISGLQPYSGRNDALRRLADLHDFDKHRTFHLTTAVAQDTHVEWSRGAEVVLSTYIGDEELRNGAIFGGLSFPLNHPDYPGMAERFRNMKVQGQAATFVAFDDPSAEELEPLRVDRVLNEIFEFVGDTIFPAFQPFFD